MLTLVFRSSSQKWQELDVFPLQNWLIWETTPPKSETSNV